MAASTGVDYFLRSGNPGLECHAVKFVSDGTTDLAIEGDGGQLVATVANTGTGEFLVTFKDSWTKAVAIVPVVKHAAALGFGVSLGAVSNEATSTPLTVEFTVLDAAGAAIDPASGDTVSLVCLLQKGTFGTR